MKNCEALIIGGSAGSLEVLLQVFPDLDPVLSFPIIIVLHRKPGKDNILIDLLNARTQLDVKEVEEKEALQSSVIYIAPPSYHLLIEKNKTFSLDASEKVNFSRPSIDVTFDSAAQVFGENLACLLLSGANNDGAKGLQKVEKKGGQVLIQDPSSAITPYMPEYAATLTQEKILLQPNQISSYINHLST